MQRLSAFGLGCTAVLVLAGTSIAETPNRRSRRTPVVEAVENVRDAVVNIAATQTFTYVRRTPFGFDSLFDEMFDLPQRRYQKKDVEATDAGSAPRWRGRSRREHPPARSAPAPVSM